VSGLLIINGTLVTAEKSCRGSVAISNGKILSVGDIPPGAFPGYEVIDAAGKLVFPGGFDPHVHLLLPTPAGNSADDFISGSRAALAGGTTTLIDFVTPRRGQSLREALQSRRSEAVASGIIRGLHLGISEWNDRVKGELEEVIAREGIRSVKTYLAYPETIGITPGDLIGVMEVARQAGVLVMVHCEDGTRISHLQRDLLRQGKSGPAYHAVSRPPDAEITAIRQVIEASLQTGCSAYIVHTSTGEGADAIASAKMDGIRIFAETCPQYLLLDDSVYDGQKPPEEILPYIISPPLRGKSDCDRLWKGLSDGTFDVVATDHCPFSMRQKMAGANDFTKIPNGAGGIEYRLPLLYTYGVLTGKISISQFVSLISTKPAEVFGFGDCKGKLLPGYDADIVIWDPNHEGVINVQNHLQRYDTEIYEGVKIRGRADIVLTNNSNYEKDERF
jgi:dihydropyrimidinase